MKAQGAFEYLVFLAAVLLVAMISISLLGFFSGAAGNTALMQSQLYWSGKATPFKVLDSLTLASDSPCGTSGRGGYQMALVNSDIEALTLTGIRINGVSRSFCRPGEASTTAITFSPQQKIIVNIDMEGPVECNRGQYLEMSLEFDYRNKYMENRQKGEKKLIFPCAASTSSGPSCAPLWQSCLSLPCCSGTYCVDGACQSECGEESRGCTQNSDCCSMNCDVGLCR
ncbi:MAG: hypothetical protein N3E51_03090 [Candidatus Micrarchaeota archaeon]|nr:hypothetical protein [Candidatus Micrarchaeota archaeon]